ncbi:response regulator transcription factor [Leucothrix sargassi]|nr:response regulator transcription factor [Leucothrix sargassi]
MNNTIRIVLVDDHSLVLEGISARLSEEENFEVVGQASNGLEALKVIKETEPDVVLMDVSMPVMDGIEAMERIAEDSPNTRVLILSMHDNQEYIMRLMRLGASGYVLKDVPSRELVRAVRTVYSGSTYISSRASELLFKHDKVEQEQTKSILTKREITVLTMLAEGLCNKEIAHFLELSVRTVEAHRQNIKSKLGIHTPAGLTKYAIEHRFVKM